MTFDICFALYNSEKWLDRCVAALSRSEYDKKRVGLYFADNASTDGTLAALDRLKSEYDGIFGAFEVLPQGKNGGFGTASNAAARAGNGENVFFYNADTEIFPDALARMEAVIAASGPEWGAFEMRQFPYEHPKYYDPVTMETSWASGACLVLRRRVFAQTGGFDESIFMYAEDVDLSWHLRALGYRIRYVPEAVTQHYAYASAGEEKPMQVAGSLAGNLVLRCKYGTPKDIADWQKYRDMIEERFSSREICQKIEDMVTHAEDCRPQYRRFYREVVQKNDFQPQFLGLDYEFARGGAFYANRLPEAAPAFTVVIRTYQRPQVLALTLESLTHQTYKNFQVLVVEDGRQPVAADTVRSMEGRLDIRYLALNEAAGRCRAGNIGIREAQTEYVCLLDDDDYFFAEHLEVMARLIEDHPDDGLFFAGSVEGACRYDSDDQTRFHFVRKRNNLHEELRLIDFFHDNPVPIQAVVFRRSLFEQYGGLDEKLDALEDWDLWMRYVSKAPFASAAKVTSIYKIPADTDDYARRDEEISRYRSALFAKMANYRSSFSAQEIYGLFWQPQAAAEREKAADSLKKHYDDLKESANEIQCSRSWRATAPLRLPFYLVRVLLRLPELLLVGCLTALSKLLDLLRRGFAWICLCWNRLADRIGPRGVDPQHATVEQLFSFVTLAKRSVSMRLPGFFLHRLHKNRHG